MREALFIKKNKKRWEDITYHSSTHIDEVADEFSQLVDDLGYAKTFYPHSKIAIFLNAEASKRYLHIYRNRREEHNKFVHFFKVDLPLTLAKHLPLIGACFLLFITFYAVGFFSSMKDETFIRDILGSSYVEMTEKNIKEGNPFGVYQRDNSLLMSLGIMINNIGVSFRYFLEGLYFFYSAPTNLIENGIMVGSFNHMFYSKGYGNQFILTVFIHGTLELSAIVITVAASIVMGKSWIFPGTKTRLQAFKIGAKEGLKILIGLVPIFIIAAFFEGFVTRYANMPIWLSLSILLLSATIIIGYGIVYPIILKNASNKIKLGTEENLKNNVYQPFKIISFILASLLVILFFFIRFTKKIITHPNLLLIAICFCIIIMVIPFLGTLYSRKMKTKKQFVHA